MKPRIRIRPIGNMGNQMLQYMFALNVRRLVGDVEIVGHSIPFWNIGAAVPADFGRWPLRVGSHLIDAEQIAGLIRTGTVRDVLLTGLGFQLENYAPADFYRDVFHADDLEAQGFDDNHLVINVRVAEILGDAHADYRPMPFSYFDTLIESTSAQPVFLGQIGDDFYSHKLRERYPQAIFQPSRGPLVDFETLRKSHQIAIAVSTFSWLAAWLSSAKVIHYPLSGWLNPQQRPDIDLTPVDDPRYRFYQFAPEKWSASPSDIEKLWTPGLHAHLDRQDVSDFRIRAIRRTWLRKTWKKTRAEILARTLHAAGMN